ncbi:EamA family transporter [Kineococcus sp. G2]|uniref:EamA family transporter n=1 Tax=Kineococcus sp. G2 TaxID=3127484 RepID=UPI003FA61362
MALVGSSAAVSGALGDAPLWTVQAVRYAAASALLLAAARAVGRRPHRPRGREWAWLAAVCAAGLVLFNVALVRGAQHAEPAVLGVAVASVPLLLAVLGPLLEGRRPRARAVVAAAVVTAGAALVQGFGRSDSAGLAWALVVLACEAAFTLLAVPVLRRHGAWGVSVHTTWMAALGFGALAVLVDEPGAVLGLTTADLLATAHLAVGVTAVAFVLWYSAVRRLGAGGAGLLTGVAPVAAAGGGVLLGGPVPGVLVWAGVVVVVGGLVLDLATAAPAVGEDPAPHPRGRRRVDGDPRAREAG